MGYTFAKKLGMKDNIILVERYKIGPNGVDWICNHGLTGELHSN